MWGEMDARVASQSESLRIVGRNYLMMYFIYGKMGQFRGKNQLHHILLVLT